MPVLIMASFFSICLKDVNADFISITDNLSVNNSDLMRVYKYRDYLNNVAFYSEDDYKYLEDSWQYTGENWYENVLNMLTNNEIKQYINNKVYNKSIWDLTQEVSRENEDTKGNTNSNNKHKEISSEDIVIAY